MTYRTCVKETAARLRPVSGEDAAFEARCLWEDLGGLPRGGVPDDREIPLLAVRRVEQAVEERLDGRPLQYILGEWEFLSLRLAVGEGVLIPRQDTELLCETAADALRRMAHTPAPQVLDLCAGSGCVGLGIALLTPGARVTAVEKSPQALRFLEENRRRYPALSLTAVCADICTDADRLPDSVDAIVANPPYIPTADLPCLMREVQREPAAALDGGADGLRFYRVIAEHWVSKLRPGGLCAVEIGWDQGCAVTAILAAAGMENLRVVRDYAGHDRVVAGFRPL